MRSVLKVSAMTLFAAALCLLSTVCSASSLSRLLLEGPALHASLTTRALDAAPVRHVRRELLQGNPQFSADPEFVTAIARSGSQGKLGTEGIQAALYALYQGESELGIYGLEAATPTDADRLEAALRKIWSHNTEINRARVHRAGTVVLVVWNDGIANDVWAAVNARVGERLTSP